MRYPGWSDLISHQRGSDRQVRRESVPIDFFFYLLNLSNKKVRKNWLLGWAYLESIKFSFVTFIGDI
jgi:hypothetical protein